MNMQQRESSSTAAKSQVIVIHWNIVLLFKVKVSDSYFLSFSSHVKDEVRTSQ